MRNSLLFALRSALVLMCLGAASVYAQDARTSAVHSAARQWLALVDRGDITASWEKAGAMYRQSMTREKWEKAYRELRAPLGAMQSRAVVNTRFTNSFPGAPDGEYSLVVFRTSFGQKEEAYESMTLKREDDGAWRTVGYLLR